MLAEYSLQHKDIKRTVYYIDMLVEPTLLHQFGNRTKRTAYIK